MEIIVFFLLKKKRSWASMKCSLPLEWWHKRLKQATSLVPNKAEKGLSQLGIDFPIEEPWIYIYVNQTFEWKKTN